MPAGYLTSTWSCRIGSRNQTAPWQGLFTNCSSRDLQTTLQVSQIIVAGFLLWGLQPIMAVRVTHQILSVPLVTAMQGPMAASDSCCCATAGDQTRRASRLIDQAAAVLTLEPRVQAAWRSLARRASGVLSTPAAVQSSNIAEAPAMAGTATNSTSVHNSSAASDSMHATDIDVLGAGPTRDSGSGVGSQQAIRKQHQRQSRCTAAAQGSHLSRSLVGECSCKL